MDLGVFKIMTLTEENDSSTFPTLAHPIFGINLKPCQTNLSTSSGVCPTYLSGREYPDGANN